MIFKHRIVIMASTIPFLFLTELKREKKINDVRHLYRYNEPIRELEIYFDSEEQMVNFQLTYL